MKRIKIAQFRYYGENHPLNFPDTMLKEESGEIICPSYGMLKKYKPILRLTIMTLPGTILYIHNNDINNSVLKYIIGTTGILDLDLTVTPLSIKGITIDPLSIEILKNNSENYFILTIVYRAEEKEAIV